MLLVGFSHWAKPEKINCLTVTGIHAEARPGAANG
jgi:hypothetical protein